MESNIKSSFIPTDTSMGPAPKRYGGGGGAGSIFDLLMLVAIVLMVASVALGIGVFLYNQYLQTSLESKRQQLVRAEAAFEPTLIAELTRLDDRMKAGQVLLERHIAPSTLLMLLEELTLETVSFSDFSFDASQPEVVKVNMQGLARSVNSIALQADLLAKHQAFSSPIFSNINRDRDNVRFDLAVDINPVALRYVNAVSAAGAVQQVPIQFNQTGGGGSTGGEQLPANFDPAQLPLEDDPLPPQAEEPDSIPNFAP